MPNDTNTAAVETAVPTTVTYAGHTIDLTTLPERSVFAMTKRGIGHFLGSEVSSKVNAWAKGLVNEDKTPREPTADEVTARTAQIRKEFLDALLAGTVGSRASGSAGTARTADPVEREMAKIARVEVTDILKAQKLKVPKGDAVVTFGNGATRTMAQMIENRLTTAKDKDGRLCGERIRAEAEKAVKASAKKTAAVTADASSAADLGL
jgi:hypothetical protein